MWVVIIIALYFLIDYALNIKTKKFEEIYLVFEAVVIGLLLVVIRIPFEDYSKKNLKSN